MEDVKRQPEEVRQQTKELWRLCFDDAPSFVEMYFDMRYSDEVNSVLWQDGKVVAALQALPYVMTFGEEEVNMAYVSGACTHPFCRNRGLMRRLLAQAFGQMWRRGVEVSTLIPAEAWLFAYYAGAGYVPLFHWKEERYGGSEATVSLFASDTTGQHDLALPAGDGLRLQVNDDYRQEQWDYLWHRQKTHPCSVLHTTDDYNVILADLRLGAGRVYSLYRGSRVVALALARPLENGIWRVDEAVADSLALRELLLRRIVGTEQIGELHLLRPALSSEAGSAPLGMGRIINAHALLKRYAAAHPGEKRCFVLHDDRLPLNNGCYCLSDGCCVKRTENAASTHEILSINELTRALFEPLNPAMSLMLNG